MERELILELGTEEIPADFLPPTLENMKVLLGQELQARLLDYREIRAYGTPRRLVVVVDGLQERSRDQVREKLGPAIKSAWDDQGRPTAAALGFARSQKVDPSSLTVVSTEKGEYLAARKTIAGQATRDLLPILLPSFIASLPFRKTMRWGEGDYRFVRPLRWLLALYGDEVVPFRVGKVTSGLVSYGHRFMHPGEFRVSGFDDYQEKLHKRQVIIDPEVRRKLIIEAATRLAGEVGGVPWLEEELLSQVVFLVEHPTLVRGEFEREFLSLPPELLMTTMKRHQKYFPVMDKEGGLLPYFLTVSNTPAADLEIIKRGNERVLRARLADAAFFFKEDRRIGLAGRVSGLAGVVFHSLLGTTAEKVERVTQLAVRLARELSPAQEDSVRQAARLAKADLLTQMVGEFPELQGIMGREYALAEGRDPQVALAIREHYLPVVSGGELPRSLPGAILALADKIDSLAGFFGVDLAPTGTADPYALRRQALGIIHIIIDQKLALDLPGLIEEALGLLEARLLLDRVLVAREILTFLTGRITHLFLSQGYPHDLIEAVMAATNLKVDPLDILQRLEALMIFRKEETFSELLNALKRVENIVRGQEVEGEVSPELLREKEEIILYERFLQFRQEVARHEKTGDYGAIMRQIQDLAQPITEFFAGVMVMVADEKVRRNRLALLKAISRTCRFYADWAKVQV
jgi:glycyl-tRNA synthetase beta chain